MAEYVQSEIKVVKPGDVLLFENPEEDVLKNAATIVLNKLKECEVFCGKYDARNGNKHYMYGISTVMEVIANYAGDEGFEDMFLENMTKSEERYSDKL